MISDTYTHDLNSRIAAAVKTVFPDADVSIIRNMDDVELVLFVESKTAWTVTVEPLALT